MMRKEESVLLFALQPLMFSLWRMKGLLTWRQIVRRIERIEDEDGLPLATAKERVWSACQLGAALMDMAVLGRAHGVMGLKDWPFPVFAEARSMFDVVVGEFVDELMPVVDGIHSSINHVKGSSERLDAFVRALEPLEGLDMGLWFRWLEENAGRWTLNVKHIRLAIDGTGARLDGVMAPLPLSVTAVYRLVAGDDAATLNLRPFRFGLRKYVGRVIEELEPCGD